MHGAVDFDASRERSMSHLKPILFLWFTLAVLLDLLIGAVIPEQVLTIIFIATLAVMSIGILLVAFGTIARNRWGINLHGVNCPRCGNPMPRVRKPQSRNQRLWGGGTCETCGCEMDKWGREIGSAFR